MSPVPVAVPGLADVKELRVYGGFGVCAVLADGTLKCWGDFPCEASGDDSGWSDKPVVIDTLPQVRSRALGSSFGCALLEGGSVYCCGENQYGQLGNGGWESSWVPTEVRF
ncbi:MAG: hypothetical protein HY744_05895 [Deltaproteobacteria bacterium]|nr:hypothetical protein [Deltaproteobacteria bacterium]